MKRRQVLSVFWLVWLWDPAASWAQEAEKGDSFRFAVYGDCRDGHEVHRRIVGQILALKPALVLATGDYVRQGDEEAQWKTFAEITGPLRKAVPFYPAIGNHDVERKGAGLYEKHFPMKTNTATPRYYSFDYGASHFIVLDTTRALAPDDEQTRWLRADLKASQGKFRHRFLAFHHPLYTLVPLRRKQAEEVRRQLQPLIEEAKPCAVFVGHDHLFYFARREGVSYVTTGGGGAPLYPIASLLARPGDAWGRYHHFLLVEVSPQRALARVTDDRGQLRHEFSLCSH